jgi:nitrogen fixation protein FixH
MVLLIILAFFGTIIAVNLVMLRFAISTFSGVGEKNAYTAGLSHDRAVAAARAQDALGWKVDARVRRTTAGRIEVVITRADGVVAGPLVAIARFEHPSDGRQDHVADLGASTRDVWRAEFDLPSGAWDLTIELKSEGAVLFRSRDRLTIGDKGPR